jgi:hypothetical protein
MLYNKAGWIVMTLRETRQLEYLCDEFSALTEENKNYVIGVSRILLRMQNPRPPVSAGEQGCGRTAGKDCVAYREPGSERRRKVKEGKMNSV